ncbi:MULTISPECIES: NAD-dependent epimerase/dehydratase family protein [Rhodococcus]|uniref:NAD-dependent epimerase/dehydratase family protein n=1 Tax=Rhodococcus TaxID=1827 RepID=UPI000B5A6DFC|nr:MULTISPECIES: NAD-dependent epimerase/dehydratase family protein [Rhodococcus]OWY79985.1 UDP-glucose 4-epimerase [Rhodococcus sp. BUPNP1]
MRTLVTGAAGFIGSNLVDRLLAEGHEVVGVDNLSTGRPSNLDVALHSDRFTFVETDVTLPDLRAVIGGVRPEVVFHLAAQVDVRKSVADPCHDAVTNVVGTVNLTEACHRAGTRRIVFAASGGSRYGEPPVLPVDENVPAHPCSPYAASKVAAELYLECFASMYGLSPISLALSNVYGPRQDPRGEAGVIAIFGSAMLTGRTTVIYGNGDSTRDYVFVGDVVDAFVRAGHAAASVTGTFNIGTGIQTSTTELHRLMCETVGCAEPPRYEGARTGEVQAIALDPSAARCALRWDPRTDMREGLRRTVEWLREVTTAPMEAGAALGGFDRNRR